MSSFQSASHLGLTCTVVLAVRPAASLDTEILLPLRPFHLAGSTLLSTSASSRQQSSLDLRDLLVAGKALTRTIGCPDRGLSGPFDYPYRQTRISALTRALSAFSFRFDALIFMGLKIRARSINYTWKMHAARRRYDYAASSPRPIRRRKSPRVDAGWYSRAHTSEREVFPRARVRTRAGVGCHPADGAVLPYVAVSAVQRVPIPPTRINRECVRRPVSRTLGPQGHWSAKPVVSARPGALPDGFTTRGRSPTIRGRSKRCAKDTGTIGELKAVKAVKDVEPVPRPAADGGNLIWSLIWALEDKQNRLVLFGKQSKDEFFSQSTSLRFIILFIIIERVIPMDERKMQSRRLPGHVTKSVRREKRKSVRRAFTLSSPNQRIDTRDGTAAALLHSLRGGNAAGG
ncbi:hypothetical protein DFH09DRAFT_1086895 [Mycena vulgaris]|nr:hypothetical protein DFH09DRAFT_1086895 [Mycena vulgaris]